MRTVIRHVKTNSALKNITRRSNSWEFQKSVFNEKTSVLFYDKKYQGNPAKSLQAALNYRDRFTRKEVGRREIQKLFTRNLNAIAA
jgi:hypothetical protein